MIYGAYAAYVVMTAHHTLCDAAWQATRYLQVEGPRFPEEYLYPDDWERVALDIAVDATAAQRSLRDQQWERSNIRIMPQNRKPVAPSNPEEVEVNRIPDYHFTVRVTQSVTNPLGVLFPRPIGSTDPNDPDAPPFADLGPREPTIELTCQYSGFFEGAPFRPTVEPGSDTDPFCEQCPSIRLPNCTPGPGPTPCPGGPSNPACPTPRVCPVCCPR